MKIPKMNKCVGCTMVCQQWKNEKDCIKNGYRDYDSADGFPTKEESWKYYDKLRTEYYKKHLQKKNKIFKNNT